MNEFCCFKLSFITKLTLLDLGTSANHPVAAIRPQKYIWLEWNFLNMVLTKFGFGPYFGIWMYAAAVWCIVTIFSRSRGACQGCPLSSLLFTVALESIEKIQVVYGARKEHKLLNACDIFAPKIWPLKLTVTVSKNNQFIKDAEHILFNTGSIISMCSFYYSYDPLMMTPQFSSWNSLTFLACETAAEMYRTISLLTPKQIPQHCGHMFEGEWVVLSNARVEPPLVS